MKLPNFTSKTPPQTEDPHKSSTAFNPTKQNTDRKGTPQGGSTDVDSDHQLSLTAAAPHLARTPAKHKQTAFSRIVLVGRRLRGCAWEREAFGRVRDCVSRTGRAQPPQYASVWRMGCTCFIGFFGGFRFFYRIGFVFRVDWIHFNEKLFL